MAGAPTGNKNAVNAKLFQDALKRALARSSKSVDGGLNKVCDQLVKAALDGEQWAIKEVGDRIDGKPAQALIHGSDPENPLTVTIDSKDAGVL
jgi:hypothetical protein